MTTDEAIAWIVDRFGEKGFDRLDHFRRLLLDASERQNLISKSSAADIWTRHLADSAQLLLHAPVSASRWVDVGSGAGLPGIVVAALADFHVTLVEPRRRRADFLREVVERLGLDADVAECRIEEYRSSPPDVISARAVAAPSVILYTTAHLRSPATTYILPAGRLPVDALVTLRREWHGMFHVEQSLTSTDSSIIVASDVTAR